MPHALERAQCDSLKLEFEALYAEQKNLQAELAEVTQPWGVALQELVAAKAVHEPLAHDLAFWRDRLQVAREQLARCRARRGADCRDEAALVRDLQEVTADLESRVHEAAADVEAAQQRVRELTLSVVEITASIRDNQAAQKDREKRLNSGHCYRFASP